MKNTNAEIVFTLPAALGGVASFNFSVINNATLKNSITTRVILIKSKEDTRPVFTDKFDVDECTIFEYSEKENQYFVHKRLETLIGKKPGAVVCDNGITIQSCSMFNNPKTIFHLLHDYFYVKQNISFGDVVDVAVAHSSFFADCVFSSNPKDFAGRTYYIPYGVEQYQGMPVKSTNGNLKVFFLGRLDYGKGVEKLIEMENLLQQKSVNVDWTIIGKGKLEQEIKQKWNNKKNVEFKQPETSADVYNILKEQDVFAFPTEFEGTPVSIMEAFSNANAVIVSDLPGGIRDMVTEEVGFRVALHNVADFANKIEYLAKNRNYLSKMQESAWNKAKKNYDTKENSNKYFELFLRFDELKRKKTTNTIQLKNKLDKPFIPNSIVKLIRTIK
ncbi:MAG: glycosyltransferase [Chitinophagaceae bacterium]